MRTTNETINIAFIAVYEGAGGSEPNRASAFVSGIDIAEDGESAENSMIECPIWENVNFRDEKQIAKINKELAALIEKHDAIPLMLEQLMPTATCSKCKKGSAIMLWLLNADEANLRHACCPCKSPGEFIG